MKKVSHITENKNVDDTEILVAGDSESPQLPRIKRTRSLEDIGEKVEDEMPILDKLTVINYRHTVIADTYPQPITSENTCSQPIKTADEHQEPIIGESTSSQPMKDANEDQQPISEIDDHQNPISKADEYQPTTKDDTYQHPVRKSDTRRPLRFSTEEIMHYVNELEQEQANKSQASRDANISNRSVYVILFYLNSLLLTYT